MNIVALIPAFNEACRIQATIQAVWQIPEIDEIVVINDGSEDTTAVLAVEAGAKLLDLGYNQGKGQALNAGWRQVPADIYLLLDADLGDSAILARELVLPVLSDTADMTIANFVANQADTTKGAMGFGLAKLIARTGIELLTGYRCQSPLSGQRALRREVLESSNGLAPGYGVEVGLTIDAVCSGYRVVEVDLPMTHRATGRDLAGFLHRGRQLWMILKTIWCAWRKQR